MQTLRPQKGEMQSIFSKGELSRECKKREDHPFLTLRATMILTS